MRLIFVICILFSSVTLAQTQEPHSHSSFVEKLGRAFSAPLTDTMQAGIPRWEAFKPRPRKECLAAANGTLDDDYKRCRFGYEEYVRYDSQGHRIVLNSRALTRY
ncbi:hypothetical protein [Oceanococcus atlanticus]|uniref:hypothetical protein n=1 Tax=Oceanococcus atlanticus TaxID=1317117 RepID=UPI0011BAC6FD|nr:hypothetical protein [Oceanococcus atlanticus]